MELLTTKLANKYNIDPWHLLAIAILLIAILGLKFVILVGLVLLYFYTGQKIFLFLSVLYLILYYLNHK
ncbi:hypothetical protein CPAV1605_564 [seawater metagenome]|uniref:Uncharacterized protein n=1 Tax=seawater metagenome TaxID=1561972 RepID=A0A5E8CJN7_9ZZZZ